MTPNNVSGLGPAVILARQVGGAREMRAEQSSGRVQFGRMSLANVGGTTFAECAIGYRRWNEFDPTNGVGQDTAVIRADAVHMVGIVADGVSQSFFGDIAAGRLTTFLLDTLWSRRMTVPSGDELSQLLKAFESEVDKEVRRHRISPNLSEITREALESTRLSGSQAVFGAFLLDLSDRRLRVYQVGDIDAVVYDTRGAAMPIARETEGRWSSAGKSDLLLQSKLIEDVSGVILRSDGAGREWGFSLEDAIPDEERFEEIASRLASKDDVSFISVCLRPGHQPGYSRHGSERGTVTVPHHPNLVPGSRRPSITSRFLGVLIGFLAGFSLAFFLHPAVGDFLHMPGGTIQARDRGLVRSDSARPSDSGRGEPPLPNILVLWPRASGYKLTFDISPDGSDKTWSTAAVSSGREESGTFIFIPFGNGQTYVHVKWRLRQADREVGDGDLTLIANHFYELTVVP